MGPRIAQKIALLAFVVQQLHTHTKKKQKDPSAIYEYQLC